MCMYICIYIYIFIYVCIYIYIYSSSGAFASLASFLFCFMIRCYCLSLTFWFKAFRCMFLLDIFMCYLICAWLASVHACRTQLAVAAKLWSQAAEGWSRTCGASSIFIYFKLCLFLRVIVCCLICIYIYIYIYIILFNFMWTVLRRCWQKDGSRRDGGARAGVGQHVHLRASRHLFSLMLCYNNVILVQLLFMLFVVGFLLFLSMSTSARPDIRLISCYLTTTLFWFSCY